MNSLCALSLRRRHGLTLVELLVILAILAVLAGLMLPAVRTSREAARRMACSNNLKQLGLSLLNYESDFGQFPAATGGTGVGETPRQGNANRLSGLVALLPYLEQQEAWEQLCQPMTVAEIVYPPMGPAPWVSDYPLWSRSFPFLQCASSPEEETELGTTNYAFSIGDTARNIHQPHGLRGAFACGVNARLDDITDGTSHTVSMMEIGIRQGLSVVGQFAIDQPPAMLDMPSQCFALAGKSDRYPNDVPLSLLGRGGCWADGGAGPSLVNTILAPNSPSCALGRVASDGFFSAGSLHSGGANVLMVDGAVQFVAEGIDTGDLRQPALGPTIGISAPSPFGVWGALGTAAGQEAAPAL